MASLIETAVWQGEIYQLEIDDFVQGGVDGIDNVPLRQLANRTLWLKQQLGTPYVENKTGATNSCELNHTPVADAAVQVFIGRLLAIKGDDYNISGKTITFTPALDVADDVRVIYRGN